MDDIQKVLVTIITPTYNRAEYLDETLQSVINQTYKNIEYIVIDDGSTDDTADVLKKYQGKIISIHHENIGEARTVNKGIGMARGEIICIVNSDDPLLPGAICKAVDLMTKQPEVLAAYSDWHEIGPESDLIREVKLPDYDIDNMLTSFNVAMGPGTFVRKKTFELIGRRDTRFKYAGDLEFWFRVALHGKIAHIPEALATHRVHPDSTSVTDKSSKMADELVEMVNKIYENPNIPRHLVSVRHKIMSNVHYNASFYCGADGKALYIHKLKSFLYDPGCYVRSVFFRVKVGMVSSSKRSFAVFMKAINIKFNDFSLFMRSWVTRYGWCFIKLLHPSVVKGMQLALKLKEGEKQKNLKFKFVFVSHVLPPSWSGQAVVIKRILDGVAPTVYCLVSANNYTRGDQDDDYIGRLPVKYHYLRKEGILSNGKLTRLTPQMYPIFTVLQRGWRIARIIRNEKCTNLVCATGDLYDLPAAWLAGRIAEIPFIPYLFDDYIYQWIEPSAHLLATHFESYVFKDASGAIVPNENLADEIKSRNGLTPTIVRNPCGQIVSKISKHGKTIGGPVNMVYTGAIYHVNFDAFRVLIHAIDRLEELDITLHLYTAQPKEFIEAEAICGTSVEIHQHLPPSEINIAQINADILFIPFSFKKEMKMIVKTSAPGKFADYLASGRPIFAVVPEESFVDRYLKKYRCGVSINSVNPERVADELKRLIEDISLRQKISENAVKRARADFSPKKSQETFLKTLERSV